MGRKMRSIPPALGATFGKLTISGEAFSKRNPNGQCRTHIPVVCDCGTELEVDLQNLKRGNTKACGNCRYKVLQGQRFGRLMVLTIHSTNKDQNAMWFCWCDCGNYHIARGTMLSAGSTTSCGCWQKDLAALMYTHRQAPHARGEDHWNWKGGISTFRDSLKRLPEYKLWKILVFTRDSRVCQSCGVRGSKKTILNAHHIDHFAHILSRFEIDTLDKALACPALWDIDNGITLCSDCHKEHHYGSK